MVGFFFVNFTFMQKVNITESYDPVFDKSWYKNVLNNEPTILITKDAQRLFEEFQKETNKNLFDFNIILNATITGMGGSHIEPNVPIWRIEADFLKSLPKDFLERRVVLHKHWQERFHPFRVEHELPTN